SSSASVINSTIIKPCFIGENASIENSVIGPYVSIGDDSIVENSIIKKSIIQTNSKIVNAIIDNSMIGNYAEYSDKPKDVSIGDYTTVS
ncbi:MAG: nucleotidyltransferase, partial [Bacteroidota bacterium]|nr:nucleotidyltransferase [Bacteroidota bacterium]